MSKQRSAISQEPPLFSLTGTAAEACRLAEPATDLGPETPVAGCLFRVDLFQRLEGLLAYRFPLILEHLDESRNGPFRVRAYLPQGGGRMPAHVLIRVFQRPRQHWNGRAG